MQLEIIRVSSQRLSTGVMIARCCTTRQRVEAAKLLMPNTVRTVADILALAESPADQLRLVVERWQPAAEVRIERIR
jgi:hypothetical protein